MVIVWSLLAKRSIKEIFNFYLPNVGREKALRIILQIESATKQLKLFPHMGKIYIGNRHETSYRSILTKHFMIFYTIDSKNILINLVWDTRRNPQQLQYIL